MSRAILLCLCLSCSEAVPQRAVPVRPDARLEIRVSGGANYLARLHEVAQEPLWQQMLPRTPGELAAHWVDVPDGLSIRDDSTVIVLEVNETYVVGVRADAPHAAVAAQDGVAVLSDSPGLSQRVLPWFVSAMREKQQPGASLIASAEALTSWTSEARRSLDAHFATVDDVAWRGFLDRISRELDEATEFQAPMRVDLSVSGGIPELQMQVGACAAAGAPLVGQLPRNTVAARQIGGVWSGAGFDETPFAWGTGDPLRELFDVLPCDSCSLQEDDGAWRWGQTPEPAVEPSWARGMRAEQWWAFDAIRMRRLVDHVAGWPDRRRAWWRSRAGWVVLGWTACDDGLAATLRIQSPSALALLYVGATRHLH